MTKMFACRKLFTSTLEQISDKEIMTKIDRWYKNDIAIFACRLNFLSMFIININLTNWNSFNEFQLVFMWFNSMSFQNQDKWKYNGPMNSNTISAIGGGISMQSSQQQSHQVPPNTIGKPPSLPQMLNPSLHQQMQNQQDRTRHNQPTVSKWIAEILFVFFSLSSFAHSYYLQNVRRFKLN